MPEITSDQLRMAKLNAFSSITVATLSAVTGIAGGLMWNRNRAAEAPPVALESRLHGAEEANAQLTEKLRLVTSERDALQAQVTAMPGAREVPPPGVSLSLIEFPGQDTVHCKETATAALAQAGAGSIDSAPLHTVYAVKGDYSLFAVCAAQGSLVVLGATGPATRIAQELQGKVGTLLRAAP